MKKVFSYLFIAILSSSLSLTVGYYVYTNYLNNENNNEEEISKIDKTVTITDNGISEGIEKIYNAVVVVQNFQSGKLAGIGSGFIYSGDGYIMTNHHVIDKATEVKIILMSGETLDATVVGSDEYADIAVLKFDSKYVTKVATFGSSEEMKVGDTVFTIGSPVSSDYAGTVTRGILSGKDRMVEVAVKSKSNDWVMNVMQTDAAINPGNSGGPLCNVNGDVIGINSMKLVQTEIEGVGFAIPIEEAMAYAETIVSGKKIIRPYLGIKMGDLSTSSYLLKREGITLDSSIKSGVVVYGTTENGPCAKAGVLKGDVIIKIGKYDVNNSARLKYYLSKYNPGETVAIVVIRGKEEKTINVTLEKSD